MISAIDNSSELDGTRRRNLFDRLVKYIIDPRRVSHKYLLQILLCLFLSGPTFFDNFFNACATDIMQRLEISHEKFSLLISIPSITGVLCGAVAGMVTTYGSTLTAVSTAVVSFVGAIVMAYGIEGSSYSMVLVGRVVFVLCWNLLGSVQKVIIFRQFTGPALAWIFAMKILAIRVGAVSGLYFAGPILSQMQGSLPDAINYALVLSGISLVCTLAFGYLYRGSSAARLIRPTMIGRRRDRPNDPSHVSGSSLAIPRDTWICCLIIFLYYGGLTPFETFGVDYLVTEYGMSRTDAGQALALIPFFSFFSPVISSLVSSVKRQIIGVVLAQVIVATSIVLEMVQFEYAPHVYLCSMGIGHMIVANALWLALASVTPTEAQKTNAASVSSAIYAVSTFAFNWMTGRVRDATGGYESAFAGLAFLVLLGASTGVYLLEWGRWKNTVANSQAHRVLLDTTDLNDVHVTTGNNPGLIVEDHFVPTGNH